MGKEEKKRSDGNALNRLRWNGMVRRVQDACTALHDMKEEFFYSSFDRSTPSFGFL
jgi:hypothetical protein